MALCPTESSVPKHGSPWTRSDRQALSVLKRHRLPRMAQDWRGVLGGVGSAIQRLGNGLSLFALLVVEVAQLVCSIRPRSFCALATACDSAFVNLVSSLSLMLCDTAFKEEIVSVRDVTAVRSRSARRTAASF